MSTLGGQTPVLITPREAAAALSIGETKVYELLATGALQSITIGSARRIPIAALESFVEREMQRQGFQP